MLNINFVPDDYIQSSESRRTNLMYLVLFGVVMAALGGSFVSIKIRLRALCARERLVNEKTAQAQDAIRQFEELQTKRRAMMKTALTTAELLEPVPRSILLASLTNNLPEGASLLRLNLVQKEPKQTPPVATSNQYRAAQAKNAADTQPKVSREKLLETHIDIEGVAASDLQVAAYIESLSNSRLLEHVALVESKENKIKNSVFRQFRLTAMLRKDVHLTSRDIDLIRAKREKVVF